MAKYTVRIIETYVQDIDVEARTFDEALAKAKGHYALYGLDDELLSASTDFDLICPNCGCALFKFTDPNTMLCSFCDTEITEEV